MPPNADRSATVVAAGDAIPTQRLSCYADDGLDQLVDEVRAADAAVVNLETLVHDFEGYPREQHGDTYMRSPPWVLDELEWAGFNLFAAANNHIADYSHGGMLATMRALESRELEYAGLGRHLAAAREPAYLDTAVGRFALVAACSTFPPGAKAGRQRPDMRGRPGLSPIDLVAKYEVPEPDLAHLRRISDELGLEAVKDRRNSLGFPAPWGDFDGGDSFSFLNVTGQTHLEFVSGDAYEVRVEADADDVRSLTRQIDGAARQADWVIASLHVHEGAGGRDTDHTVPSFLEHVARACVDAGADVVVGHGPHMLRGIELYEGSPIFYSLGNFLVQLETISRYPAPAYDQYGLDDQAQPADYADNYLFDERGDRRGFLTDRRFYESVVPVCRFENGALDAVELLPIELGFARSRPHRGRPRPAEKPRADAIIERLEAYSEPYGTVLRYEDGTWVVDVS